MQVMIELIRKLVVLVLLMEIVLQLQSGKQYEPYIKMLIGIMVVYSLVSGLFQAWNRLESETLAPMQDFQWMKRWEEKATEHTEERSQHRWDTSEDRIEEPYIQVEPIPEIRISDILSELGQN